jgi:hypothetical protein
MVDARPDYLALAAQCRAAADGAQLDNVRRKHMTAATAWESLALQADQIEDARQRRLLEKSEAD